MNEKTDREKLLERPDVQGIGGELREKYPGFFVEVAKAAELIVEQNGYLMETGKDDYDRLDAILEDIKVLIAIDPDMRR